MAGKLCPWCGLNNLDVYAYCQSCGRGFSDEKAREEDPQRQRMSIPSQYEPPREPAPVTQTKRSRRGQRKLFGIIALPRR